MLYGIVNQEELDILVICETWFDVGTSSGIMTKTFGNDFIWFGRERQFQSLLVVQVVLVF